MVIDRFANMNTPIPAAFRTLDLNLLRVFDEVMAERSLTRAANNLSLTQPAVSNALRRLRDALGDELVHRHGHGIEPTPRALALWPSVREALRQLQAAIVPNAFEPGSQTYELKTFKPKGSGIESYHLKIFNKFT